MDTIQFEHGPPFIYVGLYEHEELMSRPLMDSHVEDFRAAEKERRRLEERAAEVAYWRAECERGGMHLPGPCPWCGYYYD